MSKKIRQIGLTMIFSQILLLGFVGNWIYHQFNVEKENLNKTLHEKVAVINGNAAKKMIMSLLEKPKNKTEMDTDNFALKNSTDTMDFYASDIFKNRKENDPIVLYDKTKSHIKILFTSGSMPFSNTRPTKNLNPPNIDSSAGPLELITSLLKDMGYLGDTTPGNLVYKNNIEYNDSLSLRKEIEQSINKSFPQLKVSWETNFIYKTIPFSYSSMYSGRHSIAVIGNYNLQVIENILPQLAFCIILLLLTGITFLLAYRSMKSQYRLNELKNNFINNISHELRTPVSTVKIAIESIQKYGSGQNDSTSKEYLDMARLEMERLEELMNRVLETNVLNQGNHTFYFKSVNITALVNQVIQLQKITVEKLHGQITFNTNSIQDIYAEADELHLRGCIINLIDNSLKYCTQPPRIKIELNELTGNILFSISDNGPGITDEYLDKVFEKFFRVPTGDQHNIKGYGLGLHYVAEVIKQHKGSIHVKNLYPGICFTITFPKIQAT